MLVTPKDLIPQEKRGLKVTPHQETQQETQTDARGYFRFNARGGQHSLLLGNPSVIPSVTSDKRKMEIHVFHSAIVVKVKDRQKRDYKFEWDETSRKISRTTDAGKAVVQGVVTSKQTGKPLAGVPMMLIPTFPKIASAEKPGFNLQAKQEIFTDARGYFRFNTSGGAFHLLADGEISSKAGRTTIGAQHLALLSVKDGQKQELDFELDETFRKFGERLSEPKTSAKAQQTKSLDNAVVQGIVLTPQTKKPLAGARVILENGGKSQKSVTDARGYFRFNTSGGIQALSVLMREPNAPADNKLTVEFELKNGKKQNFRLDLGEMSRDFGKAFTSTKLPNTESTGNAVVNAATAPVAATKAGSASGQIVDENKRPLAGATAILYRIFDKGSPMGTETKSDANGRFRFEGLQPGAQFSINANKKGYAYSGSPVQTIEAGKNATFTVSLQAATAALRGVVIGEDGQPARNYTVQIRDVFVADTKTDAQGRFLFPQALPGQNAVRVLTPKGDNGWGTFNVSGGEQNAKIRLTKSVSDARFPHVRPTPKTMSDVTRALIGKTAPEIKAARWINGKTRSLQSLRGKVVLLIFDNFAGDNQDPWNDSARSTAGRLEIVGVQVNSGALVIPAARMNEVAFNAAFPIALDAGRGDENSLGGQTFSEYGMGVTGKHGYAIIGRDGKIVEAGDSLLNAFKFADRQ